MLSPISRTIVEVIDTRAYISDTRADISLAMRMVLILLLFLPGRLRFKRMEIPAIVCMTLTLPPA